MVKCFKKGKWSQAENEIFIQAMKAKSRWKEISEIVGTRSPRQCQSHNQKMKLKIFKNMSGIIKGNSFGKQDKSVQCNNGEESIQQNQGQFKSQEIDGKTMNTFNSVKENQNEKSEEEIDFFSSFIDYEF